MSTAAIDTAPRSTNRPATAAGRPRRVALLGAGYIAEWHAKALGSVSGTSLVAVCDAVLPRARALADRFGVAGAYGSLEAMLRAEHLDAVHVLLPPDLHFGAAQALLEAGVDVFLEKPMCASAEECAALVELAERRGRTLCVGHNFLFSEPYERLRRDVRAGLLGPLDDVLITWNKELPQATHGPFEAWMLRDAGNVALEIGSHAAAHLVDLCGPPDELRARASSTITLPTGIPFHRRWQVEARCGKTSAELRVCLAAGFEEQTVHVRGFLGSATADLLRNTYVLRRHAPVGDDFDRWEIAREEARQLRTQANATLRAYVRSKLKLGQRGSPYGASIARALDAFYARVDGEPDERIAGRTGTRVIELCDRIRREAGVVPDQVRSLPSPPPSATRSDPSPEIAVLGATGFIGRELVRQLAAAGKRVRVLARSPSRLPPDLRTPAVECVRGDLSSDADLAAALRGVRTVYHLARANVRTWPEYQRDEIDVTRRIAEAALASGVKRFVYSGTIDSYYAGATGKITEETPLDPAIRRRNLYARAKAESEALLVRLHRERALPLVIMRPGIVIGSGSSPFHWGVGMWWHGAVCQLWGRGDNPLPLVLVEDVAAALVAALDAPGIDGESFNLVADPCLSAREYVSALERAGGFRLQAQPTPIARFFAADVFKWIVKVLVRHPDRRVPSWRDWESRTQRAQFDNARARARLGWSPSSDRESLVRRGIEAPLRELLR